MFLAKLPLGIPTSYFSGAIPIIEYPRVLIDISRVSELKGYLIDQYLVVGAGNTLSEFMEIMKKISDSENFEYLEVLIEHLELVANVAVRNVSNTTEYHNSTVG